MVLFDILVFSGFTYSILGNVIRYYKNKDLVNNSTEKIDGETNVVGIKDKEGDDLIYIIQNKNIDKNIYLKKGSLQDELPNNQINYNNIYYINRVNKLNKLFEKYKLDEKMFPIELPLQIYRQKYTVPIYYNKYRYDINKQLLFRNTIFDKRLPISLTVLTLSTFITVGSWLKYINGVKYTTYPEFVDKPIFHPKKYMKYFSQ
jgi:hypothetical protein